MIMLRRIALRQVRRRRRLSQHTRHRCVRGRGPHLQHHHLLLASPSSRRPLPAASSVQHARTIALEPTYADAHFNLGIVHQERGRLEEALRCYDEAARLDSTLADAAAAADFVRRALKDDAKRKGANKEP